MKIRKVFWGFLVVTASLSIYGKNGIRYISCQEVAQNMSQLSSKKADRWYLINVLPRYICSECTIPDSINIPLHVLDKQLTNVKKWPRNRKIILCCSDGSSLSNYAYQIVHKLGFDDVYVLKGGMAGWKQSGYPVMGTCLSHYLDASL